MSPLVNPAGLAYNDAMKNAISYLKTLSLMLRARKSGDEDFEERMLDRLDDAWIRLSKREAELIEHVSKYVACDLLSPRNLEALSARLESKPPGPIVVVKIYKARGKVVHSRKAIQPSVYRLPGSGAVRRDSAKQTWKIVSGP
jgi:hypothetical protein